MVLHFKQNEQWAALPPKTNNKVNFDLMLSINKICVYGVHRVRVRVQSIGVFFISVVAVEILCMCL